jgi:hypothetical protein
MHTQDPSAVHEKQPAGTHMEHADSVRRRGVVFDPDPHAHLTPAERYARAIQRRDALVTAKPPFSQTGS